MPVKPTGELSSLVAQLRSSDPGSRDLECLAVGIYFESKSEPLSGQLAVGEVIANRANSGDASRPLIAACCFSAASSASFGPFLPAVNSPAVNGRMPSRSRGSSIRT